VDRLHVAQELVGRPFEAVLSAAMPSRIAEKTIDCITSFADLGMWLNSRLVD
jgi:hypothetical protein